MNIGIIDYNAGNITSLANAIEHIGFSPVIVKSPNEAFQMRHLILPGVGSFKFGMENLVANGWEDYFPSHLNRGNFLLGICLGMQLLCEVGAEDGPTRGLGFQEGKVEALRVTREDEYLPHVGWNSVTLRAENPLFNNVPTDSDFYFVHSYGLHLKESDSFVGVTSYGSEFISVINPVNNLYGVQFHPEKSSGAGLELLKNFCSL